MKEFYVNGVLKDFTPFWIDQDGDLENDPYTTDCSAPTDITHPHAYADISIHNGKIVSKTCIEKPPGISTFTRFRAKEHFKFIRIGANMEPAVRPVAAENILELDHVTVVYVRSPIQATSLKPPLAINTNASVSHHVTKPKRSEFLQQKLQPMQLSEFDFRKKFRRFFTFQEFTPTICLIFKALNTSKSVHSSRFGRTMAREQIKKFHSGP